MDSYMALVAKGSAQELQKVLELKGIRRADQVAELLEQLRIKTLAQASPGQKQ